MREPFCIGRAVAQSLPKSESINMVHRIAVVIAFLASVASEAALAQVPSRSSVKLETTTIELSNIRIVTAAKMKQDSNGSLPEAPVPLDDKKLLPPGTLFFILFDYKTDLSASEDPKAIKSISVGTELGDGKSKGFHGYGPFAISAPSGTGAVWLSAVSSDEQKNVEVETKLHLYGRRNDNSPVPGVNTETIGFTARMDRLAQISETQFEALKGMYRRLQELEGRVKALEARDKQ
ncbi:MAG: hypothetical protein ACO1RT_12785 [Planctomycetaceae bacterium]